MLLSSRSLRVLALVCTLSLLLSGFLLLRREKPYHLILITIDTLRADRLGCYGWQQAQTPQMDSLARESFFFSRCYSHSPLTLPSHASLLTGTAPPFHGIRDNGFFRLPQNIPTLASLLKESGYQTGAVVSGATLSRSKGLNQGFTEYDDVPEEEATLGCDGSHIGERIAEKSIEVAEKQLRRFWDRPDRPYFLWLHLFDPHAEYQPPSPFRQKFAHSLYDGEIAYTDHCLVKLFRLLEESGQKDRTILVLTADHGEGLGEHGEASHGYFLYNSTLHVPLLMKVPGQKPQKIDTPIRSMDVLPTVLSFLGIDKRGKAQGKDFSPLLRNPSLAATWENEPCYAETHFPAHAFGWRVLRSLTKGDEKYIATRLGAFYNLKDDRGETRNLCLDADETRLARMLEFQNELALYAKKSSYDSQSEETQEHLQKLESLSYISYPTSSLEDTAGQSKPDPTEMVSVIQLLIEAQTRVARKEYDKAKTLLQKILQQDPKNTTAWALLGKSHAERGELDEALGAYRKFDALVPSLSSPKKAILDILMQQKKYKDAAVCLQELTQAGNDDATVLSRLAYLKLVEEDWNEAEKAASKATVLSPSLPSAWFYLGLAQMGSRRFSSAKRAWESALALRPVWPEALYHYGICLTEEGKPRQAKTLWENALASIPKDDPWYERIRESLFTIEKQRR